MRKLFLPILTITLFLVSCGSGGNEGEGLARPVYIAPGIGLGTIIAVVVSWGRNKSVLWAIIHGLLGWLYVIYALLFGRNKS